MQTVSCHDFDTLLRAAQGGSESAMERLVRLYEPEVRIVARVTLGQALRPYLDTMDVVQTVHRSMLVGLRGGRFDISSPEKLVALALTIMRRKVARHWRRAQRQQRPSQMLGDQSRLQDHFVSLCSSEPNPAAEAARREQVERLFARLTEQQQNLIRLRFEGHSTAEAARRLGLNPDVARVQLNRLRQRLRQLGTAAELL